MAQRIIPLEIRNEHVIGGGVNVGAAGAHDDVVLELRFNEMWRGLTKTAVWIDALGESHTDTLLTSNFAVDLDTYQIPVPATAMQYSGRMTLTLTGVFLKEVNGEEKEIVRAVTEAVYLRVMPSYMDAVTLDEIDPSLKDQLQAEIDAVLADVLDARAAAKDAEAWAVGQIEGVDVGIDDPRYHNNAKYYSGNADTQAGNAATSATNAAASELAAAGSADAAARSAAEAEARVDLPLKKGTRTGAIIVGDVVNNTATEEYAVAEGAGTGAAGTAAHAEGWGTFAIAEGAHSEGRGTWARGKWSHAEGYGSNAWGDGAHAEGYGVSAGGNGSHAEGYYTVADAGQHVFGIFNLAVDAADAVEIVGNGTSANDRSNARTLDWDGNEWLAGKLTMEGTPTADKDAATKKYVDDGLSGKAPTNHATSATTYGAGNDTNYGHVKLSDSTSSTSGTSDGTAATPSAVKAAFDLAAVTGKYNGKLVHVKSFSISIPSGSTATELFESNPVDTILSVALIVTTPNSNVDTIMGGYGMVSATGKQVIAQAFKTAAGQGYGLVATNEATGAEATGTMIVHYTLASGE